MTGKDYDAISSHSTYQKTTARSRRSHERVGRWPGTQWKLHYPRKELGHKKIDISRTSGLPSKRRTNNSNNSPHR